MTQDARILVVDDDESSRFMMRRRLMQLGFHNVVEARDGEAALFEARRQVPDVMLLDVMMPGTDGLAILHALRQDDYLRDVAVIMISANDKMELAARSIELGAEDYLAKPVLISMLRARMASVLERRRLRAIERAFLSRFDAETELPNRAALLERIDRLMASGRPLVLVTAACSNYAGIALGTDEGEAASALRKLAGHVPSRWSKVDTVARIADDMLGWLIPETRSSQQLVLDVQATLDRTARESSRIFGSVRALTAAIAMWPASDGTPIEAGELLRLAMSEAARIDPLGDERVILADPSLRTRTRASLAVHQQLERGLDRGELELYFQPIFAVEGNVIAVGGEALLRWNHPERGLLGPDAFLDAVEHTPLMSRIDAWVMKHAIASLIAWDGNLAPTFCLHVNVTARSLASGRLTEILIHALPASLRKHLAVELTERVHVPDMPACAAALRCLRELGIHVALDDFGTGFSSLSHVSLLPCDTMKIDRSFVSGVDHDANMRCLLESLISMARSLGLTVIVEGVEQNGELSVLREAGCPLVQGYLLGKPRCESEFLSYLH